MGRILIYLSTFTVLLDVYLYIQSRVSLPFWNESNELSYFPQGQDPGEHVLVSAWRSSFALFHPVPREKAREGVCIF